LREGGARHRGSFKKKKRGVLKIGNGGCEKNLDLENKKKKRRCRCVAKGRGSDREIQEGKARMQRGLGGLTLAG